MAEDTVKKTARKESFMQGVLTLMISQVFNKSLRT